MAHLIVARFMTPEDNAHFEASLTGARLPVTAGRDMCECQKYLPFHHRRLYVDEIYYSKRCEKAALMFLDAWFPHKPPRYYAFLRVFAKCVKGLGLKAFNPRGKFTAKHIGNARNDVLFYKDHDATISCLKCDKKMYLCDY